MESLRPILLAHGAEHPQMEPRDGAKLVYQSVFGGGHLIRDRAESLARLRAEYEATPQVDGPLYETIGGGLVRVHLAALDAHGVSPETLNGWFADSAQRVRGTRGQLLQALEELRAVTAEGSFSFGSEELEEYLADYAAQGWPPVSHSETYRRLYRPAYRVVLASYLET